MKFKDELILIRHARSDYNIRKSADMNSGITEFGHKQAKNVASFMKKHMNVDPKQFTFCTSPFLRCLQTMEYIGRELEVKENNIYVLDSLREYINHSAREVTIPFCNDMKVRNLYNVTYKDETNEEFYARMQKAYNELGNTSVVVTHGLPLLMLKHLATENTRVIPLWDHNLDNCSITYIVKGQVVWYGRNLYHELDEDPYDNRKPYDFVEIDR